MKKLIISLVSLMAVASEAATLPPTTSAIQGGFGQNLAIATTTIPISSLSKRVLLFAGNGSTPGSRFFGFYKQGGATTQYQATNALYCNNLFYAMSSATNPRFGYGTAALIAEPTGTAPTGVQYFGSTSVTHGLKLSTGGASTYVSFPYAAVFPASSYPFVYIEASTVDFSMLLDCYEN